MERIVSVGGGIDLCVDEMGPGDGPLVVQLEGHMAQLVSTPESYCRRLADAGCRVVRVDNRDVGRSSRCEGARYTLADMADDVHRLIQQLGGSAVVCGRSMGGAIAQLLTLRHPDDVRGLGLFYTFAKEVGQESPAPEPQPAPFHDLASFVAWEEASLPPIAGPAHPYSTDYPARIANLQWSRGVSWDGFQRQRTAMALQEPWGEELTQVQVPTVVVHGTEDPVVPVERGRRLAELVPGATLVEVEGLGHHQPEELDDLFVQHTLALV